MKGAITHVIFDFDGTLVDSQRCIIESMQMSLHTLGVTHVSDAEICDLIGLPLREMFERVIPGPTAEVLDRAVILYGDYFASKAPTAIVPFPKVISVLDDLKGRGVKMSIATSRTRTSLQPLLTGLEIEDYFDFALGEEDVTRTKPEPEMVERLLTLSGSLPHQTVVVGDTTFDIAMGQGGGCYTVGVSYGNHTEAQLAGQGSDYVINDLELLLDLV